MSAGGAFGGSRGYQPRAPEKGVFPLDHFGECKQISQQYLACLKENANDAAKCREISKLYLQCRMDRNLMARQDLKELGFRSEEQQQTAVPRPSKPDSNADKQKQGFIAGVRR
ncbi:hypothetical protein ABBQ38_003374 [Trebouxia sp. C0009 RCD-2024]